MAGALDAVPLIASANTTASTGTTLTVADDGSATYMTILAAINAVPAGNCNDALRRPSNKGDP